MRKTKEFIRAFLNVSLYNPPDDASPGDGIPVETKAVGLGNPIPKFMNQQTDDVSWFNSYACERESHALPGEKLLDSITHFDRILCSHSLSLHGLFACFTPKSANLCLAVGFGVRSEILFGMPRQLVLERRVDSNPARLMSTCGP